ncbi:terpenoid synthase [Tilletiaria anomala UBC 951]|uniref:(2E,6E)-farnesyl diphosphate synthase n=1 Tax=Tilletiaria anomala (strain ATCC 24038 / CBS 436.72 / UBC 951) TaxID=1037660 RepID=A0A066WGJ4_TILAU|nr:terpenoid synthase [Tilletiaria anomala UBC 951]KDN53117.1 terpenoid synthase [Tilletiaria anomala UBC 951]
MSCTHALRHAAAASRSSPSAAAILGPSSRRSLVASTSSGSAAGECSKAACSSAHIITFRRKQSAWAQALSHAKNLVAEAGIHAVRSASAPPAVPGAALNTILPTTDEGAASIPSHSASLKAAGKARAADPTATSSSSPQPSRSSCPERSTSSTAIIRDPLEIVGAELSSLRKNVSSLLGSGHPSLDTIAKYYFQAEGKHVRPLIVLLMARATNGLSPLWDQLVQGAGYIDPGHRIGGQHGAGAVTAASGGLDVDEPLSPREVLNDFNPDVEGIESPSSASHTHTHAHAPAPSLLQQGASALACIPSIGGQLILPTQRRLAEITEMIHVASLLHDDVIDDSSLRRGALSAPAAFGNKLSILGGDFLLGRASVALARLRNNEVVELVATVIANLVEGEVMQLRAQALQQQEGAAKPRKSAFSTFWEGAISATPGPSEASRGPTPEVFEHYLQKTYLKTASLIGKAARAAAILGGNGSEACASLPPAAQQRAREIRDAAYAYGRNVGIAFQLVDDLLDFRATSATFGKPSGGADLRLGLATAPVLYAWEQFPDSGLGEMVARKFAETDDVEKALAIVAKSNGLLRTADLARAHAKKASDALLILPQTEARDALIKLNEDIVERVK